MELAAEGLPAVLVVTEPFKSLATNSLRARKFEDRVPIVVLPHPIEAKSVEEVQQLAEERAQEIVRGLLKEGEHV